jgi:polyisoprenoid-binding protein YceI
MAWQIDPVHSQATFAVKHVMVSTVRGQFRVLSGSLEIDEEHPENSWIEANVETASIDTHDPNRDADLRSANFFEADKYPVIHFKSTKVEATGADTYRILGILDMHGVQREVPFEAEYSGQHKDPYGNTRAGLTARARINRKDFGLTWNVALETGGVLVSDAVNIEIDLSALYKA